jgi:hypothetical protein
VPVEAKELEQKFPKRFFILLAKILQCINIVCKRAFDSILGREFHVRSLVEG